MKLHIFSLLQVVLYFSVMGTNGGDKKLFCLLSKHMGDFQQERELAKLCSHLSASWSFVIGGLWDIQESRKPQSPFLEENPSDEELIDDLHAHSSKTKILFMATLIPPPANRDFIDNTTVAIKKLIENTKEKGYDGIVIGHAQNVSVDLYQTFLELLIRARRELKFVSFELHVLLKPSPRFMGANIWRQYDKEIHSYILHMGTFTKLGNPYPYSPLKGDENNTIVSRVRDWKKGGINMKKAIGLLHPGMRAYSLQNGKTDGKTVAIDPHFLDYDYACKLLDRSKPIPWDFSRQTFSELVYENETAWRSIDDITSTIEKVKYFLDEGMAGVGIQSPHESAWMYHLDDCAKLRNIHAQAVTAYFSGQDVQKVADTERRVMFRMNDTFWDKTKIIINKILV